MALQAIPHQGSPYGIVTLSCGVAGLTAATAEGTWKAMVAEADTALYEAKAAGKDCVVLAQDDGAVPA